MVRIIILILTVFIAVTSCNSKIEDSYKISAGVYMGSFSRTLAWGSPQIAEVTLTFSHNSWSGTSDKINFPVLGQGTYKIENRMIKCTNSSEFVPESDTTLIFSGEFQFKQTYKILEIYRFYYSPVWGWDMPDKDHYILTKKE
jgi:hypothetical protein